jgi:gamma-glutamyltranspeptidase/glutathione hydrolase
VFKTGPWGQGPVLLQQLLMLGDGELRPGTAEFVHTVTEVAKLAFADREAWYGDVDDVPLSTLLSAGYAAERLRLVSDTASVDLRPGSPDGRTPRIPRFDAAAGDDVGTGGEPTVSRTGVTKGDTCHIDVVDRWGTMISATPSGGWLASSPVIGELGFPLGTRLQMTTLEPGYPTTLTPGRRPRTTLSPGLARHADGRLLSFGTPGGDQQDQWQMVFLLHHLAGGLDLQAAIDAPSFHTAHFPSSFHPRTAEPGVLVIEDRYGEAVIQDLRRRGHQVRVSDPWSLGRLSAVALDPETGVMTAAANPRGMAGYAAGR